jgi:uncharacterized protein with HEPN domain
MQPRTAKYLFDIRDCGEVILTATKELSKEQFVDNCLMRDAVERNFIPIGEALDQLGQDDPGVELQIDPNGQIVSFRNILMDITAWITRRFGTWWRMAFPP